MPKRRWHIRLSAAAEGDFVGIIEWTIETFGTRQAKVYRRTLILALAALHRGPDLPDSLTGDEIRPGLRSLHVARSGRRGRHFILYRTADAERIEVARILHDSMDISRHMPPRKYRQYSAAGGQISVAIPVATRRHTLASAGIMEPFGADLASSAGILWHALA